MNLGERIRKLRKRLGLTQKKFAGRVVGKVDYTYIGRMERGEQYPCSEKTLRGSMTGRAWPGTKSIKKRLMIQGLSKTSKWLLSINNNFLAGAAPS